jgi:hypothetical protein
MFNYYIKTLYRNERGIWQLRQWISRGTCACFLIICIYECNLWMFFYNLFIWIEYMHVILIICWYEWNMWMLSVLFACMKGISECFRKQPPIKQSLPLLLKVLELIERPTAIPREWYHNIIFDMHISRF